MKKKMICGLAFISMSALLTGCHMKHEWAEATCTEPRTCSVGGETEGEALGHTWAEATCEEPETCSVCGETEGRALGHEWQEATYESPKTCSVCSLTEGEPLPEPYFLEKGIVCEELKEFDLPMNMSFREGDELVEIDGTWLEYDNAHYTFGEITSEPAQKEGYLTITVPYEVSYSYDWCSYNSYSGHADWTTRYRVLCVCDYNTGTYIDAGRKNEESESYQEKEIEWEGNAYPISVSSSGEAQKEHFEWISEGNIDRLPYRHVISEVLTITVPEEYDGLVLYIRKDKPDIVLSAAQKGGEAEDEDAGDSRLCDEESPATFMCFRLSDIMQ